MEDQKRKLIGWLDKAYTMENEIVEILEHHAKDANGNKEVVDKINEHIELTKSHAETVKECIEKLGGNVSSIKYNIAKFMGNLKGMAGDLAKDKLLINAITEYTTENLEIATYQAIIEAADILEETEVADHCEEILQDEIEMAEWLQDNIPDIVNKVLKEE